MAGTCETFDCVQLDCDGNYVFTIAEGGLALALPEKICFKGVDVTGLFQDYVDSL